MNMIDYFNLVEAPFWMLFGVVVAARGGQVHGMTARLRAVLASSLFAFGISDLFELYTGAWWRPPALFIFKGVCLTSITLCALWVWWNRKRRANAPQPQPGHEDPIA